MEPQTELDRLIAEQRADDTNVIRPECREQVPLTDNIVEHLGVAGSEIVSYLPRPPRGSVLIGPQSWHGTLAGARRHHCACVPCRKAGADYQREYRARKNGSSA